MGCGCKNKAKQNEKKVSNANIELEIKDTNPILLDESLISQLGKSEPAMNLYSKSAFPFCKIQSNEYNSDIVSINIHNSDGSLREDFKIPKFASLENFVKVILDYEKSSGLLFSNKECIASEIAAHTYVHKLVKKSIDEYNQHKISLLMFQDRIQTASNVSYGNSPELVAEFEQAKKLLH